MNNTQRIRLILSLWFMLFSVTVHAAIGLTYHQAYFYMVLSTLQQEGYRLSRQGRELIYERMRSKLLLCTKRADGLFDHQEIRKHTGEGVLAMHNYGYRSPDPEGGYRITAEECFDCFRFKSLVSEIPWEYYNAIISRDLEKGAVRISMRRMAELDELVCKMENERLENPA